ncbi:mechanosensitive ion channel family protein [Elongatibacter sediminis]|uniref:Mechanosensitive ion channel domain-containing protein n=1 Tax=Elongatibacter sediminis TaxID=3119006 RepID=A0AAW9RG91_9GAMM
MEAFREIWDKSLVTLSGGSEITVGQATLVALFLLLALLVSRILGRMLLRLLARKQVEANVAQTIHRLFSWSFLILVLLTAMAMLQIPITALAFISGAVAIGVGFGAQNVINNLISGWILMSEKPVRVGDFIEIDDMRGTIERIGNRSTRIRRIDNVHVLVPNSQLLERMVINWTLIDNRIRTSVRVGVAYGSPARKVEALLLQAAADQKDVLADPPPVVVFEDFGDNALVFDLYLWCEVQTGTELRVIRSETRFNIEALFADNGIVVAFPQRDVHLDTTRPLEVQLNTGTGPAGYRLEEPPEGRTDE